jgi:peptidoglycan/xylan/chitin deacetylase (PgdA/CDA1 family)
MTFRVALTFDAEHPDRPTQPGAEDEILAALSEAGVAATFFVQSRWIEAQPGVARRIAGAGHVVGNHSHYHVRMRLLSDEGVATDVRHAEAVIAEALGVDPRPWFRLPFGNGAGDARILGCLETLGYRHVGWHIDSDDWRPGRTAEEVASIVVDGALAQGDGAVVLHHAWPSVTPRALPLICARLRDEGARFVTVAELHDPVATVPWTE